MNDIDTPGESSAPPPHPLARAFAREIALESRARVLLVGYGSGRNVPVLLAAGARVELVEMDVERAAAAETAWGSDARVRIHRTRFDASYGRVATCDGALSTHALLHGDIPAIAAAVTAIRATLVTGARFFLTLGTKTDPRFGNGTKIADDTFAADSGSEAGIPHAYFDEAGARALLRDFAIERVTDGDASATAGAWAHDAAEAAKLRHLFVRARKR